jgi:PAS domain S-box-containing protein
MFNEQPLPFFSETEIAKLVVDETPAIIGYIDCHLIYRFANMAYLEWFGKSREEILHRPMKEVLGPIYDANLPQTLGALGGVTQLFERRFSLLNKTVRHGLITYKPHFDAGKVHGFFVLVADVSPLKKIEFELVEAKRQVVAIAKREVDHLKQTNFTLEQLGKIGQEITTHLDISAISRVLDLHTRTLLDASYCTIYLLDESHKLLSRVACGAIGGGLSNNDVSLADSTSPLVRCALERRQFIVNENGGNGQTTAGKDGTEPLALMFAPLIVGNRIIGVMTVQSAQQQYYPEHAQLIFGALCAYGAIALDNAKAYKRLRDTQLQLIAQAKMAALGTMVAGIAHELNTPLGNTLLIASTMDLETADIKMKLQGQTIRRSDLLAYIADAAKSFSVIVRGMGNAARLIDSLKQVTADRIGERGHNFNLNQVSQVYIDSVKADVQASGHSISLDIPSDIFIFSHAHSLGDVLKILIANALTHGFDGRQGGRMSLKARKTSPGQIEITFHDNGKGIPEEDIDRVFDPFFTTRMGQGGGGLGLSICYNIVATILRGEIGVQSRTEQGTTFTLNLPVLWQRRPEIMTSTRNASC